MQDFPRMIIALRHLASKLEQGSATEKLLGGLQDLNTLEKAAPLLVLVGTKQNLD
jgi:hypothetical protein